MLYRVVIRAFTCRRDVAPASVLAELLRSKGCEVLIASGREFEHVVRLWKPHAVVINVPGPVHRIHELAPRTKVIFFEGEGILPYELTRAVQWKSDRALYDATDLILLWGQRQVDDTRDLIPDIDFSKLHAVGNPKLDVVRYAPPEFQYDPTSKQVGLICRFANINFHDGAPSIWSLGNQGVVDQIVTQTKGFYGMIRIVRELLTKTDFTISIRPHPLEAIEPYHEFQRYWFNKSYIKDFSNIDMARITIDDTLFINEWIAKCRAIISPTSTSLLEAYLAGVPVINTDFLCDTVDFNREFAAAAKDWQEAGVSPESFEELISILTDDLPKVEVNSAIEQQLREHCDWGSGKKAANLLAAEKIMDILKSSSFSKIDIHFPTWLMDLLDEFSFRRACWRNPLHPNMNYRRGYHTLSTYLGWMTHRILKE